MAHSRAQRKKITTVLQLIAVGVDAGLEVEIELIVELKAVIAFS